MSNQVGRKELAMQGMQPQQVQQQQAYYPAMQGELPVNPELLKEQAQDTYQTNPFVTTLAEFLETEPKDVVKVLGLSIPVSIALGQAMDKFGQASRGTYAQSIQGRMGAVGERISTAVTDSAVYKNSVVQGAIKAKNTGYGWFRTNIVNKVNILKAIWDNPSKPEFHMAKPMANGMLGFELGEYQSAVDAFLKPQKHLKDIDCYGASPELRAKYKARFDAALAKEPKGLSAVGQWFKSRVFGVPAADAERLGIVAEASFESVIRERGRHNGKLSPAKLDKVVDSMLAKYRAAAPAVQDKMLKTAKLKAIAYTGIAEHEKLMPVIQESADVAIKKGNKTSPKFFARRGFSDANAGTKSKGVLLGRKVYFSEINNKLIGCLTDSKSPHHVHKSWLGRSLPKWAQYGLEGITNSVAGGKMAAIFGGVFLTGLVLWKVMHAEKGDKAKTFVDRMADLIGMFAVIPLAVMTFHRAGGIQYAGMNAKGMEKALESLQKGRIGLWGKMTDAQKQAATDLVKKIQGHPAFEKSPVEAYRAVLKDFNKKALDAGFAGQKEIFKAEKIALKTVRGQSGRNPITWLFKKAANFITGGLETIEVYRNAPLTKPGGIKGVGTRLLDMIKHPTMYFRKVGGGFLRLGIIMMAILPFFGKALLKGTHAIFGRPKHSALDRYEEGEKEKKAKEEAEAAQIAQEKAMQEAMIAQAKAEHDAKIASQTWRQVQDYKKPDIYESHTNLLNPVKHPELFPGRGVNNSVADVANKTTEPAKPIRTYIPSSAQVQLMGENIDPALAALKRSENAEKMAMQTLAMK